MDINQCIDHLGLNRNNYRLDKNDSPHVIVSWDGPDPQPTQEELETAWTQIQTASDAQAYVRTRADAYPSIGDQLDMLWHAVDTGDWTAAKVKTTSFYTELKAVKDANPKP